MYAALDPVIAHPGGERRGTRRATIGAVTKGDSRMARGGVREWVPEREERTGMGETTSDKVRIEYCTS